MLKHYKNIVYDTSLIIATLILQGCGSTLVKMTDQNRTNLKNLGPIKLIYQQSGWPSLKTPLGVLASDLTLGLSEDWSEGQKLMVKFKVTDPAKQTKDKFFNKISRMNVANFESVDYAHTYDEANLETLQRRYSGTVLKISPLMMQIWYFPFDWSHYQMWFRQKAELINIADGKTIWSAACVANQDNKETAPTLDELTADNSTVLKTWVNDATTQCTQQLVDDFMGQGKA